MSDDSRARLRVRMVGGFEIEVGEQTLPTQAWPSRRSAELVQLLSLTEGHRLTRDQVMEALWPHLEADAAAANLRKAAFHSRRALGAADAVVLRGGMVYLLPSGEVTTDLEEMRRLGEEAIRKGSEPLAVDVVERYSGELLPESLYEEWTQPARNRLHAMRLALMRTARLWEELIELDPMQEEGYWELMSAAMAAGNNIRAIQLYGRLRTVLANELSVSPTADVERLYMEAVDALTPTPSKLVGRQEVLATATSALGLAERRQISCMAIRGSTGMGKTRLSREIQDLARESGWVTVEASCIPAARPYQPMISIVEEILSVKSPASLPDDASRILSMLMTGEAYGSTISRHTIVGAIEALLSAHPSGPVVIALDNVHFADEATVDLLMRWLGVGSTPVELFLMTYDSASLTNTLREGLARLRRAGRAMEVELGPLNEEDTRFLVELLAPDAVSEGSLNRVLELAGGNPALATDLANSIDSHGELRITASTWESALEWSAELDDGSVAVLKRLALAGSELTTDQIVAVTGLSEAMTFDLLERAIGIGVLEVGSARYRFREELVRQALCQQLQPHRRQSMHRDLARRLATEGGSSFELVAHHWIEGDRPEEANPWLFEAAKRNFRVGAFVDCVSQVETLLDHDASSPEALVLRAEALAAIGSQRSVTAFAEAVVELDGAQAQDVMARMALNQLKSGDPQGALETLSAAKPTTLSGRISEALTLSGAAAVGFGDPETAAHKAEEARRLALEAGDSGLVVEASWALSLSDHALGSLRARLQADLTHTAPLQDLAIRVFDGHLCASERLLYGAHPYDEVIDFAQTLHDEAERLGAVRGQGFALTLAGEAKLLAGRLEEANSDLDRAVRLHRSIGASAGEALALQRRGEVAIHINERGVARAQLERALSAARRSYLGHHLFDRIYGSLITLADDADDALATTREAERAVKGPFETCPACRITLEIPAAIAAARSHDMPRAMRHAKAVEVLSEVMVPLPGWRAAAEEVRSHVAAAAGNGEAARTGFGRAAELYRLAGQPLDVQRCEELHR